MVWLDESEYAVAVVLASMVLAPEGLAPFVVQYDVFFFERTEERRGRYRVSEGCVVTHGGFVLLILGFLRIILSVLPNALSSLLVPAFRSSIRAVPIRGTCLRSYT